MFSKICLFGWLPHSHPFCVPRRGWRDFVKRDLKNVGINNGCWYVQERERDKWRIVCSQRVELPNQLEKNVVCHVSKESVIKHMINVLWRGLNQSKSSPVLFSVNCVIDGSGVKEIWRCTDAGRMSQQQVDQ